MQVHGTPEQIAAMFESLAKARVEFSPVVKDKIVNTGKYHFSYAALDSVIEASSPALGANGLYVGQALELGGPDSRPGLTTFVTHESGAYMEAWFPLPTLGEGADMQDLGSDLTYLRRYALSAMAFVAPEDDDDGNRGKAESVQKREPQRKATSRSQQMPAVKPVSEYADKPPEHDKPHFKDIERLRDFLIECGYKSQDSRGEKILKITGKAPVAMTVADIANVYKVVEAELTLQGAHVPQIGAVGL